MKKLLTIILGALIITSCSAFKLRKETAKTKGDYNFWFVKPEVADSDSVGKPLVIFLHGASLCGTNIDRVRRYGTIDAMERGRQIDAYVMAPQNPGGSWKPEKIMRLIEWAERHNKIDTTRIYVLGMSLGGYGAIDLAARYPDKIAAAIGMCGGATSANLAGLNDVPLWIIHGTGDRAVSVKESDKVVNAIKQTDADTPRLRYDRIAGMNHSQPARMFYLQETYDWLFEHSLADSLRPIQPTFVVNNTTLGNAYKGLHWNGKKSSGKSKSKARKRRR